MQPMRKLRTTVQPGGRIEIVAPGLTAGDVVEITVVSARSGNHRVPARQILARSPGHRLFKSADEVDDHLRAERDTWGN